VVALAPLVALLVFNGVWPAWLVSVINDTVTRFLA
jgi:NADH:ubiquinone oxidoreductase subunit 4 (subunit M)